MERDASSTVNYLFMCKDSNIQFLQCHESKHILFHYLYNFNIACVALRLAQIYWHHLEALSLVVTKANPCTSFWLAHVVLLTHQLYSLNLYKHRATQGMLTYLWNINSNQEIFKIVNLLSALGSVSVTKSVEMILDNFVIHVALML
jgi:hypothetical protein